MRKFKELTVWKLAMKLCKDIYALTSKFPKSEKYNLTSQMRRSVISIPSNIAEGCSRNSEKAFKNFIEIALGSSFELETQLILAKEFGYIDVDTTYVENTLDHLQASLNSLRSKLK